MGKQKVYAEITKSPQLLQGILDQGLRIFEIQDAKKIAMDLGIKDYYVPKLLAHLVREGWLNRLKKGTYYIGSVIAFSPIHEYEIAMHVVKPAVISHYSAFFHHGLTEQIPSKVFITTLDTAKTTVLACEGHKTGVQHSGIHYQIIKLRSKKFFGHDQAWKGEGCFTITDLERTLLDGFFMPQYCGGFREVIHALEIALPRINLEKLIQYVLCLDIAVARRVGFALEQCGVSEASISVLVQPESKGYRLLDPNGPAMGPHIKKWLLRMNL